MDDSDVYEGQPVVWKGKSGYILDLYRTSDGILYAVVSVSPSSTGVGNNIRVSELEGASGAK